MTSSTGAKTEAEKASASENQVKKIVIRRLPPSMTKEAFLDIVSPLPEYDYFYFCNADMSLGSNAFCRAYICFKNHQDVFNFKDRFDNYVFVDSKSNEYPALVEYAPYQRRFKFDPQNPPKKDSKCNTLDQDTDYQKFLETFDKPSGETLPSCEAILEELEQKEKEKMSLGLLSGTQAAFSAPKVMTPLLEYMKKKREDKKSSKEKERDRDRDRRDRRRDRDRDRDRDDGDKRYGGGYGKRRDDNYYYGSREFNNSKGQSSSKSQSNQQKSGSDKSKNEAKVETQNVKILTKPQSSNTKTENDTKQTAKSSQSSNQTASSGKDTRQNSASSNTGSNYKNNSNYSYKNSNNSSSSNRNSATSGSSGSNKNQASSQSTEPKPNTSKEEKSSKDQSDKDGQKNVKNKDRPSIQIYNPAQRAAMRQQKPS